MFFFFYFFFFFKQKTAYEMRISDWSSDVCSSDLLPTFLPATPYGIVQLLDHYGVETEGRHCVVMGRSNIVGTPVSILLSRQGNPGNCTVTIEIGRAHV